MNNFSTYKRFPILITVWFAILLIATVGAVVAAVMPQSFTADALSKVKADSYPPRSFVFAVAGDTAGELPFIQSPVFKSILQQAQGHQPAFFALLGDLIRGGNLGTAPRQWEEFFAAAADFSSPILAVPGERDIWSNAGRQLWENTIGYRWYSCDYAGSHFIFLDSGSTPGQGIVGPQLAWLKNDLEKNKEAQHIFVFLHQPYFLDKKSNWAIVQGLLARYPVRAVFAAHYNRYEIEDPRYKIQYYITGGGGGEISEPRELGGFHHWLLVSVNSRSFRVEVMRPGAKSLSADCVVGKKRDEILAARREIRVSRIESQVGKPLVADGHIYINNRAPSTLRGRLYWETPSSGWKIEKSKAEYDIPRYGKTQLDFRVETQTPYAQLGALPYFSFDYVYGLNNLPIELTRGLPLIRKLNVSRAQSPIVPDGKLDEWDEVEPIKLPNQLGTKPSGPEDFSASARMLWSPGKFYVALQVKDDIITMPAAGAEILTDVDNVRLLFDPSDNGQGLRQRGATFDYLACQTEQGARLYSLQDPKSGRMPILATAPMGVNRENGVATYEFVFDEATLFPCKLVQGTAFSMNLFAADDDGPRHPEKFTLLTLAGNSAVVSDLWPRVVVTLGP